MNDKMTAKDRYDEYEKAIAQLQKQLTARLKDHRHEFEQSGGRDWGYPGDLAHVYDLLVEAADFMQIETDEE